MSHWPKSMCMAHAHAGIKGKSWWQDGGTMGFMLQVLSWKSNWSYLIIKYSKPRKLRSIPVRPCPSMFCFSCQATNTFCRSTSTTSWDDKRPDQCTWLRFAQLKNITLNRILMTENLNIEWDDKKDSFVVKWCWMQTCYCILNLDWSEGVHTNHGACRIRLSILP